MRTSPAEDDEDWGPCSDLDEPEETAGLRQAGGPLRCWQRAGFKRLTIDERHARTVLPARYDLSACCAVCGRRPGAGHPLAPLFDDTSFVSMAEVVKDVVGLELAASDNPRENVVCGDCRGYLLALHTMRGWLCALQKQFARTVVRTNSGQRRAKILVPRAYRGVDFFSREAPFLDLLETGGERLGVVETAAQLGDPARRVLPGGGAGAGTGREETAGPVPEHCSDQTVRSGEVVTERGVSGSEQCPPRELCGTSSGAAGEGATREVSDAAPAAASETQTAAKSERPSGVAVGEAHGEAMSAPQPPQPSHQELQPLAQPESHQQQQSPSFHPSQPAPHLSLSQHPSECHPPPHSLPPPHTHSLPPPHTSMPQPSHSSHPPAPTAAGPATPPRPAATAAPVADSAAADLLDPFEEYSISDLLVLRSPLATRRPAPPERPPPAKLKKIAPKVAARNAPPPAPIVLNVSDEAGRLYCNAVLRLNCMM